MHIISVSFNQTNIFGNSWFSKSESQTTGLCLLIEVERLVRVREMISMVNILREEIQVSGRAFPDFVL